MAITTTGDTGTPNRDRFLVIGGDADGAIRVDGGSDVVSDAGGAVARQSGAAGSVLVTGAGSTWVVGGGTLTSGSGGFLNVGEGGSGALTVENGAALTLFDVNGGGFPDAFLGIARTATSTGAVTIRSGGKLRIEDRNLDGSSDGINIGGNPGIAGGDGALTVQGARSEALIRGNGAFINVGRNGADATGRLDLLDGGRIELQGTRGAAQVTIGVEGAAAGQMRVSGGELLVAHDTAGTGNAGVTVGLGSTAPASLRIEGGGRVTVDAKERASAGGGAAGFTSGEAFVTVGSLSGSDGDLTIAGAGSELRVQGGRAVSGLHIGRGGEGSLLVEQGGRASIVNAQVNAVFNIGGTTSGIGGDGDAVLRGAGSALLVAGVGSFANVGRHDGSGDLSIESGARLDVRSRGADSDAGLTVGRDGSTGTMLVSDADVLVEVTDGNQGEAFLILGRNASAAGGRGTLRIERGGSVTIDGGTAGDSPGVLVGRDAGTTGALVIDGAGSQLAITGGAAGTPGMTVGRNGTGTLRIENGGMLRLDADAPNSGFAIGGNPSSGSARGAGTVLVSGAGSQLLLDDPNGAALLVAGGVNGVGRLTVTGGGRVALDEGGRSFISGPAGSTGIAVVSGAGSLWEAGDRLLIGKAFDFATGRVIGNGGDGALTIGAGGVVRADATLLGSGRLGGTGRLDSDLTNDAGTVAPGLSAGTLTIGGDFVQRGAGRLAIELGGAAAGRSDRLAVGDAATLGGTLQVTLINGFAPAAGQSFDVLTADAIRGGFTSVLLPTLPGRTLKLFETILADGSRALRLGVGNSARDGGAGNDSIAGTAGRDLLSGNAGNDRIAGGAEADHLDGGAGNDSVEGGAGNDHLAGGAGNDGLSGGAGADILRGEAGIDTASYAASAAAVSVNLATGAASGGDAQGDALSGIENLAGSALGDRLTGDAGANTLTGGAGDDSLIGNAGDDVLLGGPGNDFLNGGVGVDTASYAGTAGAVAVSLGLAGPQNTGGAGTDRLTGIENLTGGNGDDRLTGNSGANALAGGAGDDTLTAGSGADRLAGGAGDDVFRVAGAGSVRIEDSLGRDTIDATGAAGAVTINLNAGTVSSIAGRSLTLGAGGSSALPLDVVFLQDLSGSFGDDLNTIRPLTSQIVSTLRAVQADSRFGVAAFIDKPVSPFGGFGDYVYRTVLPLTTDPARLADAYEDMTIGGGGDFPESQLEALMQIGLRTGELGFRSGAARVVVLFTDADFHAAGDGAAAGITTPNDGDAVLDGTPPGSGEDFPTIAQAAARLAAADILPIFAVTADQVATYQELIRDLGIGGATVTLSSDSSNIVEAVRQGITRATATAIEDAVGAAFDDRLIGNALANDLRGAAGNDTLSGGAGNDRLEGGAGADRMAGGLGDDDYIGVEAGDVLAEAAGGGIDTVETAASFVLRDQFENLTLTGAAAVNGTGNAAANALTGNAGANRLSGQGGDDTIAGGAGNDLLTGGAGNDRFVIADGTGDDRIADFTAGDVIDLRGDSDVPTFKHFFLRARQAGADTVLDLGDGDSLTLVGVARASLDADDFLFRF